jgi:hypothetical protein
MLPNDGFGFDDDQGLLPVARESRKQNPKKTVSGAKLRPFDRPLQRIQLLAERKVFQNQIEILLV